MKPFSGLASFFWFLLQDGRADDCNEQPYRKYLQKRHPYLEKWALVEFAVLFHFCDLCLDFCSRLTATFDFLDTMLIIGIHKIPTGRVHIKHPAEQLAVKLADRLFVFTADIEVYDRFARDKSP